MLKLDNINSIVVKVGSSLVTTKNVNQLAALPAIDEDFLMNFCNEIIKLKRQDKKVVIVSSGAVALGKNAMAIDKFATTKLTIEEKQAAAAIGQPQLMYIYNKFFLPSGFKIAQILVTLSDFRDRRKYLNLKNTMSKLLEHGIIPIVNENDPLATQELRFGDNDTISALTAQLIGADHLLLLSDIDGLYTDNPNKNSEAKFIDVVSEINETIKGFAKEPSSSVGTGGMTTKVKASEIAANAGCKTIIASGKSFSPISSLFLDGTKYTLFDTGQTPESAKNQWIINNLTKDRAIVVDEGAKRVLQKGGSSLLAVGITSVTGNFERGDVVDIKDTMGNIIAKGVTAYSSANIQRIKGFNSSEIERIIGYSGRDYVVHINDMVLL